MFDKIRSSKWKNIVLFITAFTFVATSLVAILIYKFSGEINGIAEVNGREIPVYEFNYAYEITTRNLQAQNLDISNFKKEIKNQVIKSLIERELIYQQAEKEGIVATKEQVKEEILKIPAFQVNGNFDKNIYLQIINSLGLTPEAFENILQKELTVNNIKALLLSTVYVSDDEINVFIKKQLTKISGETTVIKPKEPKITEDMIKDYYEKHKKDYSSQVGKNILVLKIDIEKLGQEKAEKLAKEIFTKAKAGELSSLPAEVEKVYEGEVFDNLPPSILSDIKEDIQSLNNDKNVAFTKTQSSYFITLYKGEALKAKNLEELRNEIAAKLKNEEMKKAVLDLQKTTDITQLLTNNPVEKSSVSDVTIQEFVVKYDVKNQDLNKLTDLKVGETSKPIATESGLLIFKLTGIKEPDKDKVEEMKKVLIPMIKSQKFADIYQMYVDKLEKNSTIKINKRLLGDE